jgi:hypothetical protein
MVVVSLTLGVPASREALAGQVPGQGVDMFLAAGDQGDVEALGAELAGDGYAEAAAGSDDGDGRHGCPFWTDAGTCSFWSPTRSSG